MHNSNASQLIQTPPAERPVFEAGLFVALFSLPALALAFRLTSGGALGTGMTLMREASMFAMVGVLLWLVRVRERQSLASIGLSFNAVGKSLAWSLVAMLFCAVGFAIAMAVVEAFGLADSSMGRSAPLPLWVMAVVVARSAIAEEIFYRGYAIDRLARFSGSPALAVLLPLAIFTLAHYPQGAAMMVLVFGGGIALSAFYLWRRDTLANIVAHFVINAVPNLLLPLVGQSA